MLRCAHTDGLKWLTGLFALLLAACAGAQPMPTPAQPDPRLVEIERRTGGRLGVALLDSRGRIVLGHRTDERFAMCSTFKFQLAAMMLDGAEEGRWRMDDVLPLTQADMVRGHAPVAQRHLASGRITIAEAAAASQIQSDNATANLLLRRVGGPAAFTAWLRGSGDPETRLDRYELELNENRPGDPRDTTTPTAYGETMRRLIFGDILQPASREQLRAWTIATTTGQRRVRGALPAEWPAGDKTGTCGTAFNDIAWFRSPDGAEWVLAAFLDRPSVPGAQAEAALAEVAALAAGVVP